MARKDFKAKNDTAGGDYIGPFIMRKRIRSTTYEVYVYFSRNSKETLNEKILRMARNEAGWE